MAKKKSPPKDVKKPPVVGPDIGPPKLGTACHPGPPEKKR